MEQDIVLSKMFENGECETRVFENFQKKTTRWPVRPAKLGLIGMYWETMQYYYEGINRRIDDLTRGLESADLTLRSLNTSEFEELMDAGKWDIIGRKITYEAGSLASKGCQYVALTDSILHMFSSDVARAVTSASCGSAKFVHIGDSIADMLGVINAKRILVLETEVAMQKDFMKSYMKKYHGIQLVDMDLQHDDALEMNSIIFDELYRGGTNMESRGLLLDCVRRMIKNSKVHIDAVVLGCLDMRSLLPWDAKIGAPVVDATSAHIDNLVSICLGGITK